MVNGPEPRVVTTIDAVTPEWLTAALALPRRARVTHVDAEQIGVGVGFVGYLYRLRLTAEPDGAAPDTVVAKLPGEPTARLIAQLFRFFEREVKFYRDLAAATPVATPAVRYGAVDEATQDFVLILEDLGDRRIVDQLAACARADAELAVRTLARIHARWWDSAELEALEWVAPLDVRGQVETLIGAYRAAWDIFVTRFGELVPEPLRTQGPRLADAMDRMVEELAQPPRTLVHGDYRLDNFFFSATPDQAPIVVGDWQICGAGRGPFDLAYFVAHSLSADDRRAFGDDLVALYHAALVEHGVIDYNFAACYRDFRLGVLFCFVYPVVGAATLQPGDERGERLQVELVKRSVSAILDLNALDLLST